MEMPWVLLATALLPLLPVGRAIGPLPTMAPPLSMVVAGQRRRLVVCVVSELAPGSGHAVWISGGNGSALQSFAYGGSQEDGGTICTVALLPEEPLAEGDLACHVGPNRTSPAHSSSPIRITGTEEAPEPCPSRAAGESPDPTTAVSGRKPPWDADRDPGGGQGGSPQHHRAGEKGMKLHLGGEDGEGGSEPGCSQGQRKGDTKCLGDTQG
ncbi:pre T-cell antigen receptor alpha isoform 1-T1 [Alca torda]